MTMTVADLITAARRPQAAPGHWRLAGRHFGPSTMLDLTRAASLILEGWARADWRSEGQDPRLADECADIAASLRDIVADLEVLAQAYDDGEYSLINDAGRLTAHGHEVMSA